MAVNQVFQVGQASRSIRTSQTRWGGALIMIEVSARAGIVAED